MSAANVWALILAAGEGSRLRGLTTTPGGLYVPKQFCSLQGGASLLEETLWRAESVAQRRHVVTVVAAQHRRWWEAPLANAARTLYPQLPTLDFSRDVVQGQESRLRVLTVPACGWSDLGTPQRVADTLNRIGKKSNPAQDPSHSAYLSLAAQHSRQHYAT